MADALPAGFPSDITDVELRAVILGCVAALQKRAPDDVGTWLPELQLAVALIGISEQSRRNLATSSKIAIGSLLVAAAALAVAFVTLLAA